MNDLQDGFNYERPMIMHIDLNSCFATVEQQARPMLRGKPIAIVNRKTDMTMIVTASYEAKAMGVKLGMRLRDAKILCPELIGIESDPPKYRHVYHKLLDIMNDYSAHVTMKSIDEGIIDFHDSPAVIAGRDLEDVAREIKQRLREEIGVWMRCNIGIATNRFLAKTAASLHKPDGLDIITPDNVRQVLGSLELTELTGIAHRNEKRLNSVGIMTPLEFLDASPVTLHKVVFKSVVGDWWHQRLRGWEVDDVSFDVKRVGRQYVLERFDLTYEEIVQRLHHLCESVGSRMRSQHKSARGISVYAKTFDRQYWHASSLSALPYSSDQAIFAQAQRLFDRAPTNIREIGVHCYELQPIDDPQISLFNDQIVRERQVTGAIDDINQRWGERTIHSADTLGTGFYVKTKIPFGSTRYL
jgi:DNA polymerase IV